MFLGAPPEPTDPSIEKMDSNIVEAACLPQPASSSSFERLEKEACAGKIVL